MTTSIVLPKTLAKATTPPPTKAELIEALALRKIQILKAQEAEREAKIPVEESLCEKAVMDWYNANSTKLKPSIGLGYVSLRGEPSQSIHGVSISFNLDNIPADLKRKLIAFDALKRSYIRVPSLWDAKKEIRDEMSGILPNRVATLLKDEGAVKALDKILTQLSGQSAETI